MTAQPPAPPGQPAADALPADPSEPLPMGQAAADGRRLRRGRPEVAVTAPSDIAILASLVRLIALVAGLIGVAEATAGILTGESRAIVLGSIAVLFGLWVASRVRRLVGESLDATITGIAVVALGLIAIAAAL